jgi:imidazolonepropionase-like amidohydrolase
MSAVRAVIVGAFVTALTASTAHTAQAQDTYAITNATVVPVSGPKIANGTIVIRDGKIAAVGAGVAVPAGAQVIDAKGQFVYPGLIDSGTQLGLTEIASVPGGEDTQELGDFNPADNSLTAVNPHSELIPVTRVSGVTTVITAAGGGLISGAAALIDLAGWTPTDMSVRARAGMVMTYPRTGGFGFGFGGGGGGGQSPEQQRETRDRQIRALRNYLGDAHAYAELKEHPKANLALEALAPVMRGELPAIFDVQTAEQIRGVLALADTFKLKVILRGAEGAWRLADTLAARGIPVIVGPTTQNPPAEEPYDAVYAGPAALVRAGVKIAFQTDDAANSRNLAYNAALSTAYGLDPDAALKAITIWPAEIWGVADRYGSIEAGKVANLVVTTGDPLDVRSVPSQVFIRGRPIEMTDRHTRLYQQFNARPRPASGASGTRSPS